MEHCQCVHSGQIQLLFNDEGRQVCRESFELVLNLATNIELYIEVSPAVLAVSTTQIEWIRLTEHASNPE